MKRIPILFGFTILLIGFFSSSSCKKETIELTKIQTDTIVIVDTLVQLDTIIQTDTIIVDYSFIEEYNSGNSSELITMLPIQLTNSWDEGKVIYSIFVEGLNEGDIILANVECELTNDSAYTGGVEYNVAQFSQIIIGNSIATLPSSSDIIELTEVNGSNITPDIHHWTVTKTGTYTCQSDLGNKYINFCAYAKSTLASPGDNLKVEQDFGRLSLIIYRQ